MASSSSEKENAARPKKRSRDDLYGLRIGRDSLDSLSTTTNEEEEQIMSDPEELARFISRIVEKWCGEWIEATRGRIKDIVRNEGGSSDEERNEPTGEGLGCISPAIGELLVGWGNAWCVSTKHDMYNRHSMLREDRASSDARVILCDREDFVESYV